MENIDFKGKEIKVASELGASVTIIDGNQSGTVVTFKSGEGPLSILKGFTLTNGSGAYFKGVYGTWFYCGAGIFCDSASPTISNHHITGNMGDCGSGVFNYYSNPEVTDCIISCNDTTDAGFGGGIFDYSSNPTLKVCTFNGNMAGGFGGGMMNTAIAGAMMSNCIFSGNSTEGYGGAIYNYEYAGVTATNCTFSGNSASMGSGGAIENYMMSGATITNSILWNDTPCEINYTYLDTITYSCVQGGCPGTGNIDSDPLFVDPVNGDFHLIFPSPCKDTGDNSVVTELYDFEGDPRIAYGTVDMGADEFYTHLYWTGDATPGGNVEVKFVGLPGTSPVGLCIGTGVLDPPIPSMWGDWSLAFPIIGPIGMPQIPAEGVLIIPGAIPGTPPAPYSFPMQALIGVELTKLSLFEVN